MTQKITIEPVTRIEGHAKVTIRLKDDGSVDHAYLHINEFRGFEKFCEGRLYFEMPQITPRICGICPVSHLLASVKACDAIMDVRIPETAARLREALHCGQFVQSHALSFFHLSAPDFLLGMDYDPARRNVLGLLEANPALARDGAVDEDERFAPLDHPEFRAAYIAARVAIAAATTRGRSCRSLTG